MKKAKIIIGANFGDEGKGLATDHFANIANKSKESCLVVCHNGGSQKGHTVVTPSGLRHVFHHFGSGCFEKADTYLASEYIVNPIIFNKELEELNRKDANTKCFINKNARITTPFDMMINQIVEEYRGTNKHGSCGLGIYETIIRDRELNITIDWFNNLYVLEKGMLLSDIANNYIPKRLKQFGINSLPIRWVEVLSHKTEIIDNYIRDFELMMKKVIICDDLIINDYDCVIFEGAQGLLLDQNNLDYMPYLTPSNTGVINPIKIINGRKCDIEICYITRTYITRHGAGKFESECSKSDINYNIIDLTNIPNPYQDTIRYGKLDIGLLINTVKNDFLNIPKDMKYKTSLMLTHINETDNKVVCTDKIINVNEFKEVIEKHFDKIYLSSCMTHENIR